MVKRLTMLALALALLGFTAVGCGDDDSDNASGGDTAADTTTEGTATDDAATTETETDAETETEGNTDLDANREQAIESCKSTAESAPGLSDETKADFEELCEKAADGDGDDIREAAAEVCRKVIEETFPEDAPGREAALDACDQAQP